MTFQKKSCLLIGNSRWHWAFKTTNEWQFLDTSLESEWLEYIQNPLLAWAAVGEIPSNISLDPSRKVNLEDIPLLNCPPWLGIDRGLAAWGAFTKANQIGCMHPNGLLIADVGTVFSLTRIKANGEFIGGQLVPGFRLQLLAMSTGTKNLNYPYIDTHPIPNDLFPSATGEAMIKGSIQINITYKTKIK